jgi:hypothetical protein
MSAKCYVCGDLGFLERPAFKWEPVKIDPLDGKPKPVCNACAAPLPANVASVTNAAGQPMTAQADAA